MALCNDIPDKAAEAAQNEETFRGHRPTMLVMYDSAGAVEHPRTVAVVELRKLSDQRACANSIDKSGRLPVPLLRGKLLGAPK